MKARYAISIVLLSLAVMTCASCSDAVFATVETAVKTNTNSLSLILNINDITVPSAGTYYVSAGAVFQGLLQGFSPGTVSWTPNINNTSRPFNPSGEICNALALDTTGTSLYGGFITVSGTGSLWHTDPSFSFGSGHGTQLPMAVPGEQVTYLRAAGPYLMVGGATLPSGATQYQYELDCWNGSWTTPLSGLQYPIVGAGYDSVTGFYWAVSSPFAIGTGSTSITAPAILYRGTSPSNLAPFSSPIQPGDQINGILVDNVNHRVFIATRLNGVYWSWDGTGNTWYNVGADHQGSITVSSLCVAGPVDSPNGVVYLVGSDGYGYYTLTATGTGGMSRYGDTTILLYTCSIGRIAVDNTGGQYNILMGTNANGLWRGVFDNTGNLASGESWIQE